MLSQRFHQQVCPGLEIHKKLKAVHGLCEQFNLSPSSDIDRWSMRNLEGEQALFSDHVSNRLSIGFFRPIYVAIGR